MKLIILGPITTDIYFGGVAIFDEELAKAFYEKKWNVSILTEQTNAPSSVESIPVFRVNLFSAKMIFKREKPDMVIASLSYGKYLCFLNNDVKKIYFLHGYFSQKYYGKLKSEIAAIYQKMLIKNSDYVFANSYFTKVINRTFLNIRVNDVIHLGVSKAFYQKIKESKICKKKNSILFSGRLVASKGTIKLLEALKLLKERNIFFSACIAGDGPELSKIQEFVSVNGLNAYLPGRIEHNKLAALYAESEIFVSLNPSEPYGIVFPEALLAQCKIVCPYTGGQIEYLYSYVSRVQFVDEESPESIANGIHYLLEQGCLPPLDNDDALQYTYDTVADRILKFVR